MLYATICAIAKDEDKDLREWVLYHLAIGFEHIIIYDNNSKHSIYDILKEYVDAGLVTVIDFPLTHTQQNTAYLHCIDLQKNSTFWLALIDIDEFLVPLKNTDIKEFLDDYTEYGGLAVHWRMFGSNGHIHRPKGNIIENYTESVGLDLRFKSIVRPKLVSKLLTPHNFAYKNNFYCVNEDKFIVDYALSYPVANKIVLNHYYYKSQQDYEDKVNRGYVTEMKNNLQRDTNTFFNQFSMPTRKNTAILKFVNLLNAYDKLHPQQIAKIIIDNLPHDINKEIANITSSIHAKDIQSSLKKLNKLKRYCSSPDITILDGVINLLKNGTLIYENKGMDILSRLYNANLDNPKILYKIYLQLKQAYKYQGKHKTASCIDKFLKARFSLPS